MSDDKSGCAHDDPEADGTDYAHPAWWRGQQDGVAGAAMRWREALEKPIPAAGVMHEPLETLRRDTERLRERLRLAEEVIAALSPHLGRLPLRAEVFDALNRFDAATKARP